jgi:hypothetical protein
MSKSYIHFVYTGNSKSGLTKVWSVKTVAGTSLGTVSWFATWRKYCFQPASNCIFDVSCLAEIANFLLSEMQNHAS